MGTIAAVTAGAADARRKRIEASTAFGVVEVPWGEFLRVLALESEPLVVRARVKRLWGPEFWRYLASIKGLAFFAEGPGDATLPESAIVIEAEKSGFPGICNTRAKVLGTELGVFWSGFLIQSISNA